MNELITIEKVRGYVGENGTIFLNLEDVARGLGFVENSKSGNITVRWRTVRDYLKEFKVIAESCDGKGSEKLPEFIPENIFYKLCMKANNQLARDFQDKVADEILPAIRKTKMYATEELLNNSRNELDLITRELAVKEEEKDKWEAKVGELKHKCDKITIELKERTQKNSNFEVDKIKVAGENEDLEKRVQGAKNENKRQIAERNDVEAEFNKINKEKQTFEIQKSEKEKEKLEKELKIKKLNEKIDELRKEYAEINKQKNEISYKLESFEVKHKAIASAIEKNETFNRSIKHILNEKIDGVIGAFVNLIDVPSGFEEAIQTLSGGMFQDIVVRDSEIGKKCIEILKDRKLGRASFLPIENIRISRMNEFLPKIEQVSLQKSFQNKMSQDEVQNIILNTKGKNGIIDFARNIVKVDKKFFDNLFIKRLKNMPGGYTMTVIYIRLMLESLEDDCILYYEGYFDSLVQELALKLDVSEDDINMTVAYFTKCGLIQIDDDGHATLSQAKAMVESETNWAKYKRDQRKTHPTTTNGDGQYDPPPCP